MADSPTQPERRPTKEEAIGAYITLISGMGAKGGVDTKALANMDQLKQTFSDFAKNATREEYQQLMQSANLIPVETRIRARERMVKTMDNVMQTPEMIAKMQEKFPNEIVTAEKLRESYTKMVDKMTFPKPDDFAPAPQQPAASAAGPEQDGQENNMDVQNSSMSPLMTAALFTIGGPMAIPAATAAAGVAAGAVAAAPIATAATVPAMMTAIPVVGPAIAAAYAVFKMNSSTPEVPANNGPVDMNAGTAVQPMAVPSNGAGTTSQTR